MNWSGILLTTVGLIVLAIAITDWGWIMDRPRAQRMIKLLGRSGTRLLYGALGVILLVLGILVLSGVIGAG